jgi:hypothetical protein
MDPTTHRITRIELPDAYAALFCPLCGHRIKPMVSFDLDSQIEGEISPCPHTLFIATDDGFDYRSPLYDHVAGIVGLEDDEIEMENMDDFTDAPVMEGAFKFATYLPSPSLQGAYFGFTGIVLEE